MDSDASTLKDKESSSVSSGDDRIASLEATVSRMSSILELLSSKLVEDTGPERTVKDEPVSSPAVDPFGDFALDLQQPLFISSTTLPRFSSGPSSTQEWELFRSVCSYSRERRSKPTMESFLSSLGRISVQLAYNPRLAPLKDLYERWARRIPSTPTTEAQLSAHIARASDDLKAFMSAASDAFNTSRSLRTKLDLLSGKLADAWARAQGTPPERISCIAESSLQLVAWLGLSEVPEKTIVTYLHDAMVAAQVSRDFKDLIKSIKKIHRPTSVAAFTAALHAALVELEDAAQTLGTDPWSAFTSRGQTAPRADTAQSAPVGEVELDIPATSRRRSRGRRGGASSSTVTESTTVTSTTETPADKPSTEQTPTSGEQPVSSAKPLDKWRNPDGEPPLPGLNFCPHHKKWVSHKPDQCFLADGSSPEEGRTRSGKDFKPTKTLAVEPSGLQLVPVSLTEPSSGSTLDTRALPDSGSEESWIRRAILPQTFIDAMRPTSAVMRAANGTSSAAVGDISLVVLQRHINSMPAAIRETIVFHIMEDLATDVILSADVSTRFARPSVCLFDPEDDAAPAPLRTDELLDDRFPSFEQTIPELREPVKELCYKHKALFAPLDETPADLAPMVVTVEDDATPVAAKPYWMSAALREEVEDRVATLLDVGIIEPSLSKWASPVFFVRQGSKDRMVIDYKKVNAVTEAEPVPLSSCEDLLSRVQGMKVFAGLDLLSGYHQAPVDPASRPLTAFICHLGVYQFTRVPFGLKNAPSHFQGRMMDTLRGLLFTDCLLYVDDILVMGKDNDDFLRALANVLDRLERAKLKLGAHKCLLGVRSVKFLGYIVSEEGISVDPDRLAPLAEMESPSTIGEVRSALGLFNFYRKFLDDYATTAEPLIALTRKGTDFSWSDDAERAFRAILGSLIAAPLLSHIDYANELVVKSDASGVAIGGALFMDTTPPQTIAFFSKTLSAAERQWSINEKEAFALLSSVEKFDTYLRGHAFTCLVDHKNLTFDTHASASAKIERWRHRLSEYLITVEYVPGPDNEVADALSRVGQSRRLASKCAAVLQPLNDDEPSNARIRSYEREMAVEKAHGSALTGHFGRDETLRVLRETGANWSHIAEQVTRFVSECPVCQKARLTAAMAYHTGHLSTPTPFDTVFMDTIGPLTTDDDCSYVLVMVDGFSRWTELVATHSTDAKTTAQAIIDRLVANHGLPRRIHSDNGSQFANACIKSLCARLGMEQTFTAPYTPQHNGIVERMNAEVTRHIRTVMATLGEKEEWTRTLPIVQFLINNSRHKALGTTPRALLFGDFIAPERAIPRQLETLRPLDLSREEFVATLRQHISDVRAAARSCQQADIDWHDQRYTPKKDSFEPGDLVLIRRPKGRPTKLAPLHLGPVRVAARDSHFYAVDSLIDDTSQRVHEARLIRFKCDNIDEAKRLAALDDDEYLVDSVTDHRIVDDELFLRIHWAGYPDEADTWQPIDEDVEGTAQVDAYIREHDL